MVVKVCERAPADDDDQPWSTMLSDAQRCSAVVSAAQRSGGGEDTAAQLHHSQSCTRCESVARVGVWQSRAMLSLIGSASHQAPEARRAPHQEQD
jgi:hypothetical protein